MPDLDALVGKTLAGKYLLKGRLGTGAVFEAEEVDSARGVAVRIYDEAAPAAAAVDHENVAKVITTGREGGAFAYAVLEGLDGVDLETKTARLDGPLPMAEAIAIGLQAARGLAAAHAGGIVHGKLEPRSVFLSKSKDGKLAVKLLDLGSAKSDARKDVRALAEIVSALLTGTKRAAGEARPPLPEDLPRDLATALQHALGKGDIDAKRLALALEAGQVAERTRPGKVKKAIEASAKKPMGGMWLLALGVVFVGGLATMIMEATRPRILDAPPIVSARPNASVSGSAAPSSAPPPVHTAPESAPSSSR